MTSITVLLPDALYRQMHELVREGWFRDDAELVAEALRRYVEGHRPEMMARAVQEDVEWGLHGHE